MVSVELAIILQSYVQFHTTNTHSSNAAGTSTRRRGKARERGHRAARRALCPRHVSTNMNVVCSDWLGCWVQIAELGDDEDGDDGGAVVRKHFQAMTSLSGTRSIVPTVIAAVGGLRSKIAAKLTKLQRNVILMPFACFFRGNRREECLVCTTKIQ